MRKLYSNTLLIVIPILLFTFKSYAQFKVDAQLRDRFELRDGYQKIAADGSMPAAFVSQHTRISFCYETGQTD